jgi:hypothetical protein
LLSHSPTPPARRTKPRQGVTTPARLDHLLGRRRHYSCLSQLHTRFGQTIPPRRPIAEATWADNPSARSDSPSQRTCPTPGPKRPGQEFRARGGRRQTNRQNKLRSGG